MANYLRHDFHTNLATSLLNDILYKKSNYYYFLGKTVPWSDINSQNDDFESDETNNEIRSDIVFMKRITSNDISLVTKRVNWTDGFIFDKWDHTKNMTNKSFYCVNVDNRVYKCLDNAGSSPSTVMPSGKPLYAFRTTDGYLWKYMYSIPQSKVSKFMNYEYIPVQRALSDSFYNKGSIDSVTVLDSGSGYYDQQKTNIVINSEIGVGAILLPIVSAKTGELLDVKIINQGTNYFEDTTLTVVGEGGYGVFGNETAIIHAVTYQGKIVRVNIIDPGANYPVDDSTTIESFGDGKDASFTPVIYQGKVIDVIVENPGTDYTYINLSVKGLGSNAILNPIITASDFTSDQSIIEQTNIPGAIYAIEIENGGTGYTSSTICSITGDGSGAEAHVIVNNLGQIIRVVLDKFGSNYTYVNVTFSDSNRFNVINTDAIAYAILPPNNGHGYNAIKELYGNTLSVSSSFRLDNSIDILNQTYRQFGIIKNPTDSLTNKFTYVDMSYLVHEVVINSIEGIELNDILLKNDIKFRVIHINDNSIYIQQLSNKYIDLLGSVKSEKDNRNYLITSILFSPNINKYSGDLLCVSNETPLSFGEDRGLVIKTYLKF